MMDDFTPLTAPDHWLGWLGDNPPQMVRHAIEDSLQQQVPSAKLDWVHLVGEAEFLTGGREILAGSGKMLFTRAALAVEFELEVSSDEGVHHLHGVFSWVARGLDGERSDRTYFDVDTDMEWAAEMLKSRIYDWDVFSAANSREVAEEESPQENIPVDEPPTHPKRSWQFWRKQSYKPLFPPHDC